MASKAPAKSILKKTAQASNPNPATAPQSDRDRKNFDLALQHAYVIQYQKDVQAKILSAIEELLEIPASSTFTAAEAQRFTTLAQLFQPSDYDALIEERRIDGRCGYALCANAPRTVDPNRSWKLSKGAGDWCSELCAKKALYVKTQLSEVPAWERRTDEMPDVVLHEDDRDLSKASGPAITSTKATDNGNARAAAAERRDLAHERGEKATSFKPRQVMTDSIVEKTPSNSRVTSRMEPGATSHTNIEGYEPKGLQKPGVTSADQGSSSLLDDIDLKGVGFNVRKVSGMLPDDDEESGNES